MVIINMRDSLRKDGGFNPFIHLDVKLTDMS